MQMVLEAHLVRQELLIRERSIPASVRCHLPEARCGLGCFGDKFSDMLFSLMAAETVRMQKGKFLGQERALGKAALTL